MYGVKELFAEAMLENSSTGPPRRLRDFAVSAAVQTLSVVVPLLRALYFTQALEVQQLNKTVAGASSSGAP